MMEDGGIEIDDLILGDGDRSVDVDYGWMSAAASADAGAGDGPSAADAGDGPSVAHHLPDAADAAAADADDAGIGPADGAGPSGSKMNKKKLAIGLVAAAAVSALVIGLGAGLGTKGGARSSGVAASKELSLEDCLAQQREEEIELKEQSYYVATTSTEFTSTSTSTSSTAAAPVDPLYASTAAATTTTSATQVDSLDYFTFTSSGATLFSSNGQFPTTNGQASRDDQEPSSDYYISSLKVEIAVTNDSLDIDDGTTRLRRRELLGAGGDSSAKRRMQDCADMLAAQRPPPPSPSSSSSKSSKSSSTKSSKSSSTKSSKASKSTSSRPGPGGPTNSPTKSPKPVYTICPDPNSTSYPITSTFASAPRDGFKECHGDCQASTNGNDDCADGLICYEVETNRGGGRETTVPGCRRNPNDRDGADYCVSNSTVDYLIIEDDPSSNNPSGKWEKCQGYCTDDSSCAPGLLCFDRTGDELIPGCCGTGSFGDKYCYNASDPPHPPVN